MTTRKVIDAAKRLLDNQDYHVVVLALQAERAATLTSTAPSEVAALVAAAQEHSFMASLTELIKELANSTPGER